MADEKPCGRVEGFPGRVEPSVGESVLGAQTEGNKEEIRFSQKQVLPESWLWPCKLLP